MASTIVTKTISSLDAVTSPSDTDLLPVATSSGSVLKKLTFANLISKLKSDIATVEYSYNSTLTANLGVSLTFQAKRVNGLVFGHVEFNTKTASLTAWTRYGLCNSSAIPEKLRPNSEGAGLIVTQQNGSGSMGINADGSITYTPHVTMINNMLAGAQFCYLGK